MDPQHTHEQKLRRRVPDPLKVLPTTELAAFSRFSASAPPSVEEARYVLLTTRRFNHHFYVLCERSFKINFPGLESVVKTGKLAGCILELLLDVFQLSDEKELANIDRLLAIGAYLHEMNAEAEKKYSGSPDFEKFAHEAIAHEHMLLEENLKKLTEWKNSPMRDCNHLRHVESGPKPQPSQ